MKPYFLAIGLLSFAAALILFLGTIRKEPVGVWVRLEHLHERVAFEIVEPDELETILKDLAERSFENRRSLEHDRDFYTWASIVLALLLGVHLLAAALFTRPTRQSAA